MDKIIKATYYGNTPETCRHIIRSYLEYSQFGKLIEEHPNKYEALGCFEDWWNEYISDGEDEFVEQDQTIEQLEAELEATRKKIAEQLSMVGRSIQSIDPTLYDKERVLEQAVIDAHLDAENEFVFNPKIQQKQYAKRTLPIYQDAPLVEDGPIAMPQAEQNTSDWKQELVDFINDKSKKYDMPRDKHGYVNLMAQLAENNERDAFIYQKLGQDDSNTLSDLLAEYDFEGMDSAQVYASLDPTSTTSDNNESNASKLNETPTKEDV